MFIYIRKKHIIITAVTLTVLMAVSLVAFALQPKVQAVQSYSWGLHFEKKNEIPIPNLSDEVLNPYNAYFHGDTSKKTIYITFDAGYENGYTAPILDALKKHNAPAAFFLVGPNVLNHLENLLHNE